MPGAHAWRRLAARPLHSLLSTGILALGLAAAFYLFGPVNSMLLRPLPFADAGQLVAIGWATPENRSDTGGLDTRDWLALRPVLPDVFSGVAVDGGPATVAISDGDHTRRYSGALLDAGLLPLLGIQPMVGRGFSGADDQPGAPLVVLIGEHTWRNEYSADPAVIGTRVRANGEPATIIGVLPGWFTWPYDQQAWIPRRLAAGDGLGVELVARLAPGVDLEQARLRLGELTSQMGGQLAGARDGAVLNVIPLHQRFVGDTARHIIWMVFAAGLMVLLLACVNVASLQLAALLPRRRELAVRSALGAGRGQLLRELMAEAVLIATAATFVAVIGTDLIARWHIGHMTESGMPLPFFIRFEYDWRARVMMPVLALATCLVAGLAPALRAADTRAREAMGDGARGSQGGFFARLSRWLVVGQIALTVVLLAGAAMFIRGINGMLQFDTGARVDADAVLTARIGMFAADYPQAADRGAFLGDLVRRLEGEPGVLAASAANAVPGWSNAGVEPVQAYGAERPAGGHWRADIGAVDPGFARVYGLRLLEGRFFDDRDRAGSLPVAVVDQRAAARLWPDQPALGRQLVMDPDGGQPRTLTVVGVIGNLHLASAGRPVRASVLLPVQQQPPLFTSVAIRVDGDAAGFAPQLAAAVRQADPHMPAYWLQTQAAAMRQARADSVVVTELFSVVGLLALLLAAAGLYGVLGFFVEQRTREIGIRRAIGSRRSGVAALVLRRLAGHLAAGLLIGVAIALPWSALLANPAFNTRAHDPVIFAAIVVLVVVVGLAAAMVPLRRALRVDPITALRHD